MILWVVKLISMARRAVAGRKYPHQMAWAVAFGLWLGIVPHGNLLALILLVVVVSLKINHAMAALTAVAATFVATSLDPISHRVGDGVLTNPRINEAMISFWQLPLVPWTDLNNTVVLGSFLIGLGALLPVFAVTYPLFRLFRPAVVSDLEGEGASVQLQQREADSTDASTFGRTYAQEDSHGVVMVDQGHSPVTQPHIDPSPGPEHSGANQHPESTAQENTDFVRIDEGTESAEPGSRVVVETRIDVIRMKDYQEQAVSEDASHQESSQDQDASNDQPMDEALNYLLRQLRDSQQRKAA